MIEQQFVEIRDRQENMQWLLWWLLQVSACPKMFGYEA